MHPLLRGRDVVAWSAEPGGHIFAPYGPDDLKFLEEKELKSAYREGWRWLRGHASVLKARKAPPTRSWDLTGTDWCRLDGPIGHMASSSILVVRELQQRPAAAVLELRHDPNLGRTTAPLVDHKLMFCAVDSPDEAVYLAAMINSTPIQDLLASYANEIAVSPQTMARLPIPGFDLATHQPGVDAGRKAIEAVRVADSVDQAEVDKQVVVALGIPDYELPVTEAPQPTQEALDLSVE